RAGDDAGLAALLHLDGCAAGRAVSRRDDLLFRSVTGLDDRADHKRDDVASALDLDLIPDLDVPLGDDVHVVERRAPTSGACEEYGLDFCNGTQGTCAPALPSYRIQMGFSDLSREFESHSSTRVM